MFDFSFAELMLIGVVALVVVGPERLPKVARVAGRWLGRTQRFMNKLAEDINREMEVDNLRKMQENAQAQLMKIDETVRGEEAKVNTMLVEVSRKVDGIGRGPRAAEQDDDFEDDPDAATYPETERVTESSSVRETVTHVAESSSSTTFNSSTDRTVKSPNGSISSPSASEREAR